MVHRLEKAGWPVLRMDVLGNIKVQDDEYWIRQGRAMWTHPELRPASPDPNEESYRLRSHDPDPQNQKPLWPEKYTPEVIDGLRHKHLPHEFNRLYLGLCHDEATAMCKREYIERCLTNGRNLGHYAMRSKYEGSNLTFTGLDLAVSPGEEHDDTAFFTFEILPDGMRVILDIDVGQWDGPTIMRKLIEKVKVYRSIIRVESNAAQMYIKQFALHSDVSLPVKAHMTGRAKAHPEHGVPGIFLEMANGAWAIPNDRYGKVHPHVQRFIDGCLYYTPSKHTDDVLMAAYFAREQAREWGVLGRRKAEDTKGAMSIADNIMSR
jgi:hypothetical protein